MGMGKNLIIFCFLFSFFLWLIGGYSTPALEIANCFTDPNNKINSTLANGTSISNGACSVNLPLLGTTYYSLYTILWGTLLIFGTLTVGITLLIGRFPDPYVYFAVGGLFLLMFATFPVTMFNQTGNIVPGEIQFLIGGLFIISYILSFFEFYKGGSL